jgi:intracellular sulfur oxidation DsrE/DsrF family protein
VFELIGSEKSDYLPKALKKIEDYKEQLQAKFPTLEIAVVSHGAEQFNLTSKNKDKEKESHTSVQRLVAADVPVHICETHASWRGVKAEDFPEYITPTSQGPTQIKSYQEMGYTLVVIE